MNRRCTHKRSTTYPREKDWTRSWPSCWNRLSQDLQPDTKDAKSRQNQSPATRKKWIKRLKRTRTRSRKNLSKREKSPLSSIDLPLWPSKPLVKSRSLKLLQASLSITHRGNPQHSSISSYIWRTKTKAKEGWAGLCQGATDGPQGSSPCSIMCSKTRAWGAWSSTQETRTATLSMKTTIQASEYIIDLQTFKK